MTTKLTTIRQRLKGAMSLSKRQQFVLATLVMTLLLMGTQIFSGGLRVDVLLGLVMTAYVFSAVVLRQDLSRWEYVTLLILPSFYTGAVFLFYFLLPERWLTRLPIALLYALGMYAILLTENIYNVAAERTIQLLRAAHSVGFLLTLITTFFLIQTMLSLRLEFYLNAIISMLIIFPLSLQTLWSMELTSTISSRVWIGSFVIALVISELVLILSFLPVRTTIEALYITTVFYTLVGMTQQLLIERLFKKTVQEYLIVFTIVSLLVLWTVRWGEGIV